MKEDQALIDLRRQMHQCAESGWLEYETTIKIIKNLRSYGLDIKYGKEIHKNRMGLPTLQNMKEHAQKVKNIYKNIRIKEEVYNGYTGAVGILDTGKKGPTIAFRFDIDSNDIKEKESLHHRPFKEGFISKNEGMMHACGHDGHIAMGLVLAKRLMEHKDELCGKILFLFQPAEEGVRGAKSFVGAGVCKDIDYMISGHIGFMGKMNEIICGVGGMLATTKIDISFLGKSAHAGAYPEMGKNALLGGANCAINLHTLPQFGTGMSRINVGTLHAGNARNTIPNTCKLEVETRGETQKINEQLVKRSYEMIKGAAHMYELDYDIQVVGSAPHYDPSSSFHKRIGRIIKEDGINITLGGKLGASEDISHIFREVEKNGGQTLYMIFGTHLKAPHHHECFDFDEKTLSYGCRAYEKIAYELCGK